MGVVKSHKNQRLIGKSFLNQKDDGRKDCGGTNVASQGFVVVTHEELQQLRVGVYPYIL